MARLRALLFSTLVALGATKPRGAVPGRGSTPVQVDTEPPIDNAFDDVLDDADDDHFEYRNPDFTDDGKKLFESDLVLTAEQLADRQALVTKLWTSPVSFAISSDSETKREKILAGIQHWRDHTCLEFTEVAVGSAEPHIYFINSSGCWSNVGQSKQSGPQAISIGNSCGGLGTVVHEIAHAMGIYHQQSRTDREDYVRINHENIQQGKGGNFKLARSSVNLSVPYDLTSTMHYGSSYFSANGKKTIEVLDIQNEDLIGSRDGFSHRDKQLANAMYGCAYSCQDPPTCQNGGFVDKYCTCVCPDNTEGEDCSTLLGPYYGELDCGDVEMDAPGYITTPNFPDSYPTNVFCYWIITAPDDQQVKITFDHMQTEGRNRKGKCKKDYVGLRHTGDIYNDAQKSCGTELTGQSYTSTDNQFVVKFKSGERDRYNGFNATVEFVSADAML